MQVFLNGKFVAEELALVSVFDRSFLYGDGLFETMRVSSARPFLWEKHLERLEDGAAFLRIQLPFSSAELRANAEKLIAINGLSEALLRLTVSRGVGPRGYSPKGADDPVVTMSLHPAPFIDSENPPLWRLVTASVRLPADEALARFKTCNKLPQIIARSEAEAFGADEAVLLNTNGHLVEGASSNLLWVCDDAVCTSPLSGGVLPGVTREVVAELCGKSGLAFREVSIKPKELLNAEGVFLSLSSVCIAEAVSLDGRPLQQLSSVPKLLYKAFNQLLAEIGE